MNTELSSQQAYKAYDAIVQANKETLEEILIALREIHKKRLYLEEFQTFEDYVNARLNWSKSKAYRLLELTKSEGSVSHDGTSKQQKQGENEQTELQDTAGQHVASVKHSTVKADVVAISLEGDPDSEDGEFVKPAECDQPKPWEEHLTEHENWFHEELDTLKNDPELFEGDMLEQLYHSINELHKRADKEPAFTEFKSDNWLQSAEDYVDLLDSVHQWISAKSQLTGLITKLSKKIQLAQLEVTQ